MRQSILKLFIVTFNIIITYLSMLSIRSKKIYVFGAWTGNTFSDNPKYLYLEAIKDKSLTAVWITKNRDIYTKLRAKGFKVYTYKSLRGIYYQLRASVYFTCMSKQDVSAILMGNATRINLWHGVGLKKILYDDKITSDKHKSRFNVLKGNALRIINYLPYRRKEYILSTSDTMSGIFAGAFRRKKEKILQLGQPRNDVFFCDELELEDFTLKTSAKKIILYMPTHRDEGVKRMCMNKILDLDILNRFCLENNIIFLIKKHFYHNTERESLDNYSHIKDITQTDYDSQQVLKYADILITDYSSCYVDYLLLNRPVIFYNYDYDQYILNDRDLYFDYDTTTPGVKVKDFKELHTALQETLTEGTDHYKVNREFVKNIFYSEDNQKKVGEKILKYVKEKL
jgi:CDP-glycerol glycerophosphotransferase (TagB/SpsB family)